MEVALKTKQWHLLHMFTVFCVILVFMLSLWITRSLSSPLSFPTSRPSSLPALSPFHYLSPLLSCCFLRCAGICIYVHVLHIMDIMSRTNKSCRQKPSVGEVVRIMCIFCHKMTFYVDGGAPSSEGEAVERNKPMKRW